MTVVMATTNVSLANRSPTRAGSKTLCVTTVRILSALPREHRALAMRWTTSAVMDIKEQLQEAHASGSTRATKTGTRPMRT